MNIDEFSSFYKNGEKTAVIFPTDIIGGHEIMALNIIKKIFEENSNARNDILISYPEKNEKLKEIITEMGANAVPFGMAHRKMEIVHSFFNPVFIAQCLTILKEVKNREVILIQGDIQQGSGFIVAAKLISKKIKSYIPYAHSYKKMNANGAAVKDPLAKLCYKLCRNYITISNTFKEDILAWNSNAVVEIVHNFVPAPKKEIKVKEDKDTSKDIYIVGRVHFPQKGHDTLYSALSGITDKSITLHVIGDGPDLDKLKSLGEKLPGNISVVYYGWLKDCWSVIESIDLLIIPSRFEGVPLIMLEALERNVSTIAANRDGMKDYLSPSHLYDISGDEVVALREKIQEFLD